MLLFPPPDTIFLEVLTTAIPPRQWFYPDLGYHRVGRVIVAWYTLAYFVFNSPEKPPCGTKPFGRCGVIRVPGSRTTKELY